jgi:hypothetical protein
MDPLSLLWLFFVLSSLQPVAQRQWLLARRRVALAAMSKVSKDRNATVITLIHRQESMSLFGSRWCATSTSTTQPTFPARPRKGASR